VALFDDTWIFFDCKITTVTVQAKEDAVQAQNKFLSAYIS
jgi:hypothetical protein